MMSFNDFVHEDESKYRATSIIKIQKIPSYLSLNDVGIHSGDGPFKTDVGIVDFHPFRGSHWIC